MLAEMSQSEILDWLDENWLTLAPLAWRSYVEYGKGVLVGFLKEQEESGDYHYLSQARLADAAALALLDADWLADATRLVTIYDPRMCIVVTLCAEKGKIIFCDIVGSTVLHPPEAYAENRGEIDPFFSR